MTKHPTFDVNDLRAGLGELDATPAALSKRAIIKAMVQEIDAAIARGVTLQQIKAYLDGKGLDLQLNSLRQYVADARRSAAGKPPRKGRTRPPAKGSVTATAVPASKPARSTISTGAEASQATPGTDASKFVTINDEDL